jgi:DNA-binding GntR family transcriptional regulator
MVKGTAQLDRPVPLYMQVVRQLRAQIASGDLAEGERIPSQREMMQHWRISMQTASKVIGALKTEGLAIASIGRDTIVAPGAAARIAAAAAGPAQASPDSLPEQSHDLRTTAALTGAPAEMARILGIPAGRRAVRRQETRTDGGQAISITTTWFPPDITAAAPKLADSQPLPAGDLAYIAEATGNRASRVTEENAAAAASPDVAATLGAPPGSPILLTQTRHENATGQLIAYSQTVAVAGNWHTRKYTIVGT